MGSFLFKWEHPAQDVHVTGTFDDWGKTQKLEKVGNHFEKLVTLSKIDENIYYKYVVDDNWVLDHTDPQETDHAGNTNNILTPEHIKKDMATRDLGSSALPGAFPETPAVENQTFGVNPIAGSAVGIGNPVSTRPGEPLPVSTKSIDDNVTLDKASYDKIGSSTAPQLPDVVTPERERAAKGGMFGLDTTPGAGTMIPESGLAMGAGAGFGAAALAQSGPHVSSVGSEATTVGLASKVPVEPRGNDAFISSVGPTSTTANLASQVPVESSGVPDVVGKSQEAAHVSPEASANPEAVQEKSAVEQELQSKVPEAQATSNNTISGKAVGLAAGAAAGVTAAAAGATAYIASTKLGQDAKSSLPVSAQQRIDDLAKSGNGTATSGTPIAATVPDTVQESISKAHQSPEAAANAEAVKEKAAVESELLKKTHTETSANAIAATVPETVQESISKSHVAPEAAANAEAVNEKSAVESELLKKVPKEDSTGVPAPTASAATATTAPKPTDSGHIGAAVAGGVGATAATGAALAAIANKSTSGASPATSKAAAPVTSTGSNSNTLAAPATSQAQSDATAAKSADESTPGRGSTRKMLDSRDVSPMTRGPNDTSIPAVTTGVASAGTEVKSEAAATTTPKKTTTPAPVNTSSPAAASSSTAASPSSAKTGESPAADKKKNRRSGFFGRLKEKLEHRKDKN